MDIRQLRYFITVAEHLNFTKAANQLYVAQSAISHQIADLEEQVGVKLFIRNKRSVQLTPAGAVFLKEAMEIVEKTSGAIEKAKQTDAGVIGNLSIGFLSVHVRSFLPGVIKRFRELYPKVELHLNHFPSKMLKEALEEGEIDIALTQPTGLHRIEEIEIRTVAKERYCIVMNENHPLASRKTIKLVDLETEPFIIHNRHDSPIGSYDFIVHLCEQNGLTPRIVSQPRFVDTVPVLVESEIGISILPKSFEAVSSPSLRFIEIDGMEGHDFELVMAWKKNNLNPSISMFLDVLAESNSKTMNFKKC
ncbi:LysR family transcriptional regulator [Bacillus sp. ISL-18]|uniref:LysR family transcriptional regulator n=1 Tax=Bacillus sp. ISL-18 TaxID=2819118 RepID=UPI001BE858A1|nr:LysR family transcriptional regulator [Bacillus sp. ISL-18]MBT2653969.1 LysR family transcriptional regulator [Bacillus sp. ISL-18]